jgi:hypothetical protein
MGKDWKIDTWWKKTLFAIAIADGFLTLIYFIVGLIMLMTGAEIGTL